MSQPVVYIVSEYNKSTATYKMVGLYTDYEKLGEDWKAGSYNSNCSWTAYPLNGPLTSFGFLP